VLLFPKAAATMTGKRSEKKKNIYFVFFQLIFFVVKSITSSFFVCVCTEYHSTAGLSKHTQLELSSLYDHCLFVVINILFESTFRKSSASDYSQNRSCFIH